MDKPFSGDLSFINTYNLMSNISTTRSALQNALQKLKMPAKKYKTLKFRMVPACVDSIG